MGMMTSSQGNWPGWSRPTQHDHVTSASYGDTGSRSAPPPRHFWSPHVMTTKMASFRGQVGRVQSEGGRGGLASAALAAYERWTTAVETERRRRVCSSGLDHSDQSFDDVHRRLVDILDAALRRSSTTACGLPTALSLTAVVNGQQFSDQSPGVSTELLQQVRRTLQSSQQVGILLTYHALHTLQPSNMSSIIILSCYC